MAMERERRRGCVLLVLALLPCVQHRTWLSTRSSVRSSSVLCRAQADATLEVECLEDPAAIQWTKDQGAASWLELLEDSDAVIEAAEPSSEPRLRRLLQQRASAEGALPASLAVRHSPALRRAVRILRDLHRDEGGRPLNDLIDVALDQMAKGQLDWSQICSVAPRLAAHAEEAQEAIKLLTLGNNMAEDVILSGGNGLCIDGRWNDASITGRLERTKEEGWGQWASFFLAEGPEELLGHRMVACKRTSGGNVFNPKTGEPSFKSGDQLYLAMPDRAAVLELATYDQLPEFAVELARLLQEGVDEKGIVGPAEMVQAAKFLNSIKDLNEAEEAERRLYRFEKSPLSRRLYDELQSDPVWAEFWTAITPRIPEIYKAFRQAMLRSRPAQRMEPRRVSVLRINVLGVLGLLAIVGAVAWAAWQFFHPSVTEEAQNLPLYSLRGEAK